MPLVCSSLQPRSIENLHDAAKYGDEAAAAKYIEEGADVNGKVGGAGAWDVLLRVLRVP